MTIQQLLRNQGLLVAGLMSICSAHSSSLSNQLSVTPHIYHNPTTIQTSGTDLLSYEGYITDYNPGEAYYTAGLSQNNFGSVVVSTTTSGHSGSGSDVFAYTEQHDAFIVSGGSGFGYGKVLLHFSSLSASSDASDGINEAQGLAYMQVHVWDSSQSVVAYLRVRSDYGDNEVIEPVANEPCTYDPITKTFAAPFRFSYGASNGLIVLSGSSSLLGGSTSLSGALIFELPEGSSVTSESGTQYLVTPAANVPEVSTLAMYSAGLLLLAGFLRPTRREADPEAQNWLR